MVILKRDSRTRTPLTLLVGSFTNLKIKTKYVRLSRLKSTKENRNKQGSDIKPIGLDNNPEGKIDKITKIYIQTIFQYNIKKN